MPHLHGAARPTVADADLAAPLLTSHLQEVWAEPKAAGEGRAAAPQMDGCPTACLCALLTLRCTGRPALLNFRQRNFRQRSLINRIAPGLSTAEACGKLPQLPASSAPLCCFPLSTECPEVDLDTEFDR